MQTENILKFLNGLKKNNTKAWFDKNRKQYETAKTEFLLIVEHTITEVAKFDKSLQFLTAKDCLFRINRDVRFSNDKSPYKTNFGGFIVPEGKKSGLAGYYIHIEPEGSFIAGGIHMPQPDVLKAVREEIYENVNGFKKIINNTDFKKYFGTISGSKITLAPKGFAKDFQDIDLLKFKEYTVIRQVTDKEVLSPGFMEEIKKTFKVMFPFNQFLNKGITYLRENK